MPSFTPSLIFFLYGLAAGFVLLRLRGGRARGRPTLAVAWVTMVASFALATLLLAWAVLLALETQPS